MIAATALLTRSGSREARKLPSLAAMLCLIPCCLGQGWALRRLLQKASRHNRSICDKCIAQPTSPGREGGGAAAVGGSGRIERDAKAGKLDKLMAAEARANHAAGRREEF